MRSTLAECGGKDESSGFEGIGGVFVGGFTYVAADRVVSQPAVVEAVLGAANFSVADRYQPFLVPLQSPSAHTLYGRQITLLIFFHSLS